MAETATREDPALSYKFYIEIQGLYVAEFTECGGLEMEREVEPYAEGGVNDFVHQLPGRVKYSDITLKTRASPTRTTCGGGSARGCTTARSRRSPSPSSWATPRA